LQYIKSSKTLSLNAKIQKKLNNMEEKNFQKFRELLNSYSMLPEDLARLIYEQGRVEPYSKDEIIFHEKRFNDLEYFQLEGLSHRYIVDNESNKLTTGIYEEQIVITPHFGRTANSQSIFSLQALSDSTYFIIPAITFEQIRRENIQIEKVAQNIVTREYIRLINLETLFRASTAKERLVHFRENFSQLENRIPHMVIASYLGITSVSLSRLRKELSRE
jgi:CRP-like cAMP-binding protein